MPTLQRFQNETGSWLSTTAMKHVVAPITNAKAAYVVSAAHIEAIALRSRERGSWVFGRRRLPYLGSMQNYPGRSENMALMGTSKYAELPL